jgi:hypothetical protein
VSFICLYHHLRVEEDVSSKATINLEPSRANFPPLSENKATSYPATATVCTPSHAAFDDEKQKGAPTLPIISLRSLSLSTSIQDPPKPSEKEQGLGDGMPAQLPMSFTNGLVSPAEPVSSSTRAPPPGLGSMQSQAAKQAPFPMAVREWLMLMRCLLV